MAAERPFRDAPKFRWDDDWMVEEGLALHRARGEAALSRRSAHWRLGNEP